MSCQRCGVTISLVAQERVCRCGGVFCDKHRQPEKHDCTYDHQAAARERLKKDNPQVAMDARKVNNEKEWIAHYWKFHDPRNLYTLCHSLGFLILVKSSVGHIETTQNSFRNRSTRLEQRTHCPACPRAPFRSGQNTDYMSQRVLSPHLKDTAPRFSRYGFMFTLFDLWKSTPP